MRYFIFTVLLLAVLAFTAFRLDIMPLPFRVPVKKESPAASKDHASASRKTQKKAELAKEYAMRHGYNSRRCFLVDMSIHSGQNRFFVYNFSGDSVELRGLVTHGSGSDQLNGEKKYSNQANSHCTSLGHYKVGHSYYGRFGLAYKLYGLDAGNSKAFERFVVLHAHDCVPDGESYPLPICRSYGCPTVSPSFLTKLQPLIDEADKPLLLWIYDE